MVRLRPVADVEYQTRLHHPCAPRGQQPAAGLRAPVGRLPVVLYRHRTRRRGVPGSPGQKAHHRRHHVGRPPRASHEVGDIGLERLTFLRIPIAGLISGLAVGLSLHCAPETISVEDLEQLIPAGNGGSTALGGTGGAAGAAGISDGTGGTTGRGGSGGTGGKGGAAGTAGKPGAGGSGGKGGSAGAEGGFYAPRSGPFKLLAYSKV